jgi:hypothetical protein
MPIDLSALRLLCFTHCCLQALCCGLLTGKKKISGKMRGKTNTYSSLPASSLLRSPVATQKNTGNKNAKQLHKCCRLSANRHGHARSDSLEHTHSECAYPHSCLYTYIYTYIYIHAHLYKYKYIQIHYIYTYTYKHRYIYIDMCVYVCLCVYIYMYIYTHTHTHTHTYTVKCCRRTTRPSVRYICGYTYICICTYTCMCMYIHTYIAHSHRHLLQNALSTHIHTYNHIHM